MGYICLRIGWGWGLTTEKKRMDEVVYTIKAQQVST